MENKTTVKPIPEGYHSITPSLVVKDAAKAIDFYKKAFGAEECYRLNSQDGSRVVHGDIKIGDSHLMIGEEGTSGGIKSAESLGNSPVSLYVYVEDADKLFKQVIDAGCKEFMAMEDTFWGDRCGGVIDPFGLIWNIATRKEDLSPRQIEERAKEFFARMSKPAA